MSQLLRRPRPSCRRMTSQFAAAENQPLSALESTKLWSSSPHAMSSLLLKLGSSKMSPLTQRPWHGGQNNLLQSRRVNCQMILTTYHERQEFVHSGETGSGKSTQIPQFLFYDELPGNLKIACIQPMRVAATSIARRVSPDTSVAKIQVTSTDTFINQNGRKNESLLHDRKSANWENRPRHKP